MGSLEPEQLSQWYQACGAELVLYARLWLETGQAEDVIQDVFVSLITLKSRPDNIRAWLYRAVRNAALNRLRRRRRWRKHHRRLMAEQCSWFEHRTDDLIDAQTAERILQSLPQAQREVVVLRIWGRMPLREVAEIVGSPVSTVFSRYQAALEAIKKEMQSKCHTKKD